MPKTDVIFYKELGKNGAIPVLEWLLELQENDREGYAKCYERLARLAEQGHELRRPQADYLNDGIYELRARGKQSKMAKKTTQDALKILDRRMDDDPELRRLIEEERKRADVAQIIYDARIKAELSQAELARRVGTHQSAIARLEDADYDGHSIKTLNKIAQALGLKVEVKFVKAVAERVGAR